MKYLGFYLVAFVLALAAMLWVSASFGQQDHAAGHNDYSRWSSQKTGNCCNNEDCGELAPESWRETNTGMEIKIDDDWCPVLQEHYIITGKSPNAEVAHACVRHRNSVDDYNHATNCRRLLCVVKPAGT